MKEDLHAMISLSPNNKLSSSNDSIENYSSAIVSEKSPRAARPRKSVDSSFLDSVLGPIRKGPKHPKKHDSGLGSPSWSTYRPKYTFDPVFRQANLCHHDIKKEIVRRDLDDISERFTEKNVDKMVPDKNINDDKMAVDLLKSDCSKVDNSCIRIIPRPLNLVSESNLEGKMDSLGVSIGESNVDKVTSYASMCKSEARKRNKEKKRDKKLSSDV